MSFSGEVALRLNMYKNRAKLNYLLSTGTWATYYCTLLDENTLVLPKVRSNEKNSKLPKTITITTKPCFNETNKIYEYHAVEGKTGTIDWFGSAGGVEDKEDRRLITQAIEAGERIAKADATNNLFDVFKNYANYVPMLILILQFVTIAGLYVLLNP